MKKVWPKKSQGSTDYRSKQRTHYWVCLARGLKKKKCRFSPLASFCLQPFLPVWFFFNFLITWPTSQSPSNLDSTGIKLHLFQPSIFVLWAFCKDFYILYFIFLALNRLGGKNLYINIVIFQRVKQSSILIFSFFFFLVLYHFGSKLAPKISEMASVKVWMILLVVSISVAVGGRMVAAQVHHVVGGDRGWEPSNDLASWFAGRDFRVGDIICKESFILFFFFFFLWSLDI